MCYQSFIFDICNIVFTVFQPNGHVLENGYQVPDAADQSVPFLVRNDGYDALPLVQAPLLPPEPDQPAPDPTEGETSSNSVEHCNSPVAETSLSSYSHASKYRQQGACNGNCEEIRQIDNSMQASAIRNSAETTVSNADPCAASHQSANSSSNSNFLSDYEQACVPEMGGNYTANATDTVMDSAATSTSNHGNDRSAVSNANSSSNADIYQPANKEIVKYNFANPAKPVCMPDTTDSGTPFTSY